MNFGERFVGFDPATGDDSSAYAEITKMPENTIKIERILCVPPVQKELCPWPDQPVTKGWNDNR